MTRKPGQSIQIGDEVIIFINRVRPGEVSIGIRAPKDIKIDRNRDEIGLDVPEAEADPE